MRKRKVKIRIRSIKKGESKPVVPELVVYVGNGRVIETYKEG